MISVISVVSIHFTCLLYMFVGGGVLNLFVCVCLFVCLFVCVPTAPGLQTAMMWELLLRYSSE